MQQLKCILRAARIIAKSDGDAPSYITASSFEDHIREKNYLIPILTYRM